MDCSCCSALTLHLYYPRNCAPKVLPSAHRPCICPFPHRRGRSNRVDGNYFVQSISDPRNRFVGIQGLETLLPSLDRSAVASRQIAVSRLLAVCPACFQRCCLIVRLHNCQNLVLANWEGCTSLAFFCARVALQTIISGRFRRTITKRSRNDSPRCP